MTSIPEIQLKAVNWVMVIALVFNLCTGVWFASQLNSRVESLETAVINLHDVVKENKEWQVQQRLRLWSRVNEVEATVGIVASDINGMKSDIKNIDKNVDRLIDSMPIKKAER